ARAAPARPRATRRRYRSRRNSGLLQGHLEVEARYRQLPLLLLTLDGGARRVALAAVVDRPIEQVGAELRAAVALGLRGRAEVEVGHRGGLEGGRARRGHRRDRVVLVRRQYERGGPARRGGDRRDPQRQREPGPPPHSPSAAEPGSPLTPRGSCAGLRAGAASAPAPARRQASSAQCTEGNAISAQGISSGRNSRTSRLSSPAA